MDPELVGLARALAPLRWSITVGGADHVPATGPALLVANRRLLAATPLLVAASIGRATGREVRFTGIADIAPLGPAAAATSAACSPDRTRSPGLLRDGQLPAVWCRGPLVEAGRCRARAVPGRGDGGGRAGAPRGRDRPAVRAAGAGRGRSARRSRDAGPARWPWPSWPTPCATPSSASSTRPARRPGWSPG